MTINMYPVLVGLAWFGELHLRHICRVWHPQHNPAYVRRHMSKLVDDGLVYPRGYADVPHTPGVPPKRKGYLWSLTAAGQTVVHAHGDGPARPVKRASERVLAHDLHVTDAIVTLLEQAHHAGLSGVTVEREATLPNQPSMLRADSIVSLRFGGAGAPLRDVPWTTAPLLDTEYLRRFWIEVDCGTTAPSIVARYATQFAVLAAPERCKTDASFPVPLWITLATRRRDAVLAVWKQAWSNGMLLCTTINDVQHNRWFTYAAESSEPHACAVSFA